MPFSVLGLDPKILQAVKEAGYTEPTPIQLAAIPPILAGQDLIGIAQTGTGKTAAFTLPMLTKLASVLGDGRQRGTRALVLAPTRELALQIEENVKAYGKHLPFRVAVHFRRRRRTSADQRSPHRHASDHRLSRPADGFDAAPLRRFFPVAIFGARRS